MTKKFVVVAVLLGVATIAFAKRTTGSDVAVVKSNESVFKVLYQATERGNVQVRIANSLGEIVFKESFKNTTGFVRPYNLSELPKGSYSITVDNGNTIRTEVIEYVQVPIQKSIQFHQLSGENKVSLTGYASGQSELIFKVKDLNGQELFSELQVVKGQFGKLFHVKNISAYTIEVHDASGLIKSVTY